MSRISSQIPSSIEGMSIKVKLIAMLVLISAVPLAISTCYNFFDATQSAMEAATLESNLRNENVEDNVAGILDANFVGLRALAADPAAIACLRDPVGGLPAMQAKITNNNLYTGGHLTILSDATGQQLVRNDGLKLNNIGSRDYFKKAIQGEENISDVIVSKATGKLIVVIALPVRDESGNIIGILQQNYDVSVLRDLVMKLADDATSVFIIDREGKLLAHSGREITSEEERTDESGYAFVKEALAGKAGDADVEVNGEKHLVSYSHNKLAGWAIVTATPYAHINEHAYGAAMTSVLIGLALLVAVGFIAWALAEKITRPILAIRDAAGEIAHGNMSIDYVDASASDELGMVAAAFNKMLDELNHVLGKVRQNAELLAASAEELSANSEQSAKAANQITESISSVASGATRQREVVDHAAQAVGQMQQELAAIAANSKHISESSHEAMDTANQGTATIDTAIQEMDALEGSVRDSEQTILALGERSKEIGQIVETISNIAGQTNLLALNAAIEAARAGEQGRGFSVVADEVRKLAEQSGEAAERIHGLISDVQNRTIQAVEAMHRGTAATMSSVKTVRAAEQAFRDIVAKIETLTANTAQNLEAVRNADAGGEQIVQSIRHIDEVVLTLARETETVSSTTEEQSASIEEVAVSSHRLSEMAGELQKATSSFKLK